MEQKQPKMPFILFVLLAMLVYAIIATFQYIKFDSYRENNPDVTYNEWRSIE